MPRSVRRAAEVLDLFSVERPYWGPSAAAGGAALVRSPAATHSLCAPSERFASQRQVYARALAATSKRVSRGVRL